ncbi:MAG: DUF3568 family protein [Phycisphaeraceae bacterium]|nr:DUF3568 family protein [Phycisphaeraceae bacterium]
MPRHNLSNAIQAAHTPSRPFLFALFAAAALLSAAGCETIDTVSSSGAGDSYSYVMGDMSATEIGQLATAMEAARTVLESSNYRVTSFMRDEVKGTLVAETSQGRAAQMEFEQMGLDRVRMKVRVGVIGDRDESRRILDAIRLRL